MTSRKKQGALLYLAIMGATSAVVGFRAYAAEPAQSAASVVAANPATTSHTPRAAGGSSGSSPRPTPSHPSRPKASAAPAKPRTVTGKVVQTHYGPVQVSVTVTGTRITDVAALQTPSGDGHSMQLARRATPTLRQEVLASQSAQIDTVSGATYTSQGYAQSVQSALDSIGF
ncbi:MAG: hypothetical protein JWP61_1314 [Friedmanniella sp.]|nr:hypothetical protein [Friedmanniella sp.]